MDTKFIDAMAGFMATDLQRIEVKGLPPFYVGPMTIKQASDIQAETDEMVRIARHFQVRAKDENGKLCVPPGLEFDKFCKKADINVIAEAVGAIDKALDSSEAQASKN